MDRARTRQALGLAAIVFADALIALADTLVKAESARLSLWQIYVGRGLVALPLLSLLALLRDGRGAFRPRRPLWVALRSLLLLAMWSCYYSALPFLELSLTAVALYTAPLFIALLASRLAGEAVGLQRWLAVLLGFLGVVVSLRPDGGALDWAILLPIVGAFCYALAMVITSRHCSGESPFTLSLGLNGALFLAGLIGLGLLQVLPVGGLAERLPFLLTADWRIPVEAWPLLLLLGVLIVVFSTAVALAYQLAPPALAGIFSYSYLLFAALWAGLLLGEIPGPGNAAGLAIIALAGGLAIGPKLSLSSVPAGRGSRR